MRLRQQIGLISIASAILPLAACVILSGCHTPVLMSETLDKPGLIYYLPKTIVRLEIAAYGFLYVKDGVTPPDPSDTAAAVDNRDIAERIRVIRIRYPTDTNLPTVQTTPKVIADLSRSYSLHYDSSAVALDRVCMGVSDSGLLSTVEAAADDKTSDIIVSVSKLAGRLLGPGAFAAKRTADQIAQGDDDNKPLRSISVEIDPLNRRHWQQVNNAMRAAFGRAADGYTFRVEDIEDFGGDATLPEPCPVNSVCYRTSYPVKFTLSSRKGITSAIYLPVINRKVTGHIDVSRALMVEKITRLKFSDGVLSGVSIRKPSEGYALAKLPLTVMDAITTSALAAPGDLVGKVSGANQQQQMINNASANAKQIANLQTDLANIRNTDLSDQTGTGSLTNVQGNTGYIQLQCVGAADKQADAGTAKVKS
jgi:hypothetical protein